MTPTPPVHRPYRACEHCTCLGVQEGVDIDLLIAGRNKTLREANILSWSTGFRHVIRMMSRYYDVSLDVPFEDLSGEDQQLILYGPDEETRKKSRGRRRSSRILTGIIPNLERRYRETESEKLREYINRLMSVKPCPVCHGARLKAESLAVTVGDINVFELSIMPIRNSEKFLAGLELSETDKLIGGRIIKEIRERLRFLDNVGVGYLALDRMAGTLSGGEGQRIRLATQIGSSLVGVLYILYGPSVALPQPDTPHPRSTPTPRRAPVAPAARAAWGPGGWASWGGGGWSASWPRPQEPRLSPSFMPWTVASSR